MNEKTKNPEKIDLSVTNLPKKYTIDDTQSFINDFRLNYLKKVRKSLGYSLEDVQLKTQISKNDLEKIEAGHFTHQHMMALNKLADLYEINYHKLLYLLKLINKQYKDTALKMAACHDPQIDEATLEMLSKFVDQLKDF
jgi:hypothetical protein